MSLSRSRVAEVKELIGELRFVYDRVGELPVWYQDVYHTRYAYLSHTTPRKAYDEGCLLHIVNAAYEEALGVFRRDRKNNG